MLMIINCGFIGFLLYMMSWCLYLIEFSMIGGLLVKGII